MSAAPTNNTEIGLAFEYNGLGRVEGQAGGPNGVVVRPGAYVPATRQRAVDDAVRTADHGRVVLGPANPRLDPTLKPAPAPAPILAKGREAKPIPFGESPKALRLFGKGLGDQAGWLLPFALFGLIGLAVLVLLQPADGEGARGGHTTRFLDRRDPAWRRCSCLAAGSSSRPPC